MIFIVFRRTPSPRRLGIRLNARLYKHERVPAQTYTIHLLYYAYPELE